MIHPLPIRFRSFWLLVLLISCLHVAGCARRVAIKYPDTPGGQLLRQLYTAPPTKDAKDTYSQFRAIRDPATRDSLKPAMLAIIGQDDSLNALSIAMTLSEWDPHLSATAPQFRNLLPAISRGLRAGNDQPGNSMGALSASMLLFRMNRDAAWSVRKDLYAAFNAPAKGPIDGDAGLNNAWTYLMLTGLLAYMGEDAIPAVVKALDHSHPVVRTSALEVLTIDELPDFSRYSEGWQVPVEKLAANTPAARAAAPQVIARLWDPDKEVRSMAAQAVGTILTPDALTPEVRERLFELVAENDGRATGRGMGGARYALSALHPAATPLLWSYFDQPNHPRHFTASSILRFIGPPILPDIIARLAKDPDFDLQGDKAEWTLRGILRHIGGAAIPALAQAAASAPDPLTRQRAQICLDESVGTARRICERTLASLNNLSRDSKDVGRMLDYIHALQSVAPIAASALPTLQQLAKAHTDPKVRTAAQAAIDQITRDKIDLPDSPKP